ncbi:MAG: carbohydrate binding domain-containing protein [Ruminococcus sp.]|uniref:alpha/beta hydrolase-fold protein n=1 Tax=Ruminococcus sp. TaxID=41978 RepID=UPI0025CEACA7|nr:alpha/beta hydrolase-fold protein [Ruminococcus sp.]MCR4796382.1 carbohydrate binding domain-containing protein [Ruminococcus sp.]
MKKKIFSTMSAVVLALSCTPAVPACAAEDEYILHSTFEEGSEQWSGRGAASVKTVSGKSRSGEASLYTSGRTNSWNGATVGLGSGFSAGQDYAFSAYVMTEDTSSPVTFYLTLQYSDGSSTSYPKIAEVTAEKGQWAHLESSKFTIPDGAKDIQLYVENDESNCDFYLDEVVGAKSGTVISEPAAAVQMSKGDINYDGTIDSLDIIAARRGIINGITDKKTLRAADADSNGVFEVNDAVLIMQFVAGKIKEFPVNEPVVVPGQQKYTCEELTEKVQSELVNNEPSSSHQEKSGVQYGTIKKENYFSKKANKNKPYNILLPANYDPNKKYPVLYVLHGFFENEDRMITKGNGTMYTRQIVGNAIAEGAAKDMIVVCPFIFTSATMRDATGFGDAGSVEGYNNFVDDIVDSLMPHIEEKYSVATGRENTAVTGFSMGGMESLMIGMKHGDKFGYVGAICPAPGGSGAFKWSNPDEQPYLLMITGGTQDDVVGLNTPEGYHNNFNKNGVPHVWHVVQNGHHGDDSIHSHLYCFVRGVFQATEGDVSGSSSTPTTQTPTVTPTETPSTTPTETPSTSTGQRKYSMEELTKLVQNKLVNNEPSSSHNKKQGVQYGTLKRETYFSKKANKNKPYNILLPANYDPSKKYPVLYLLHGFFENENRMITQGNGQMYTQQIIGNAIAEGEAKDMIVVVPFVFTSATMNDATGFADQGSNQGYDNFVDDIVDSLMPHIESKYSVATGRENTAVTGFSMGGRESLQIGMKHGDKFGYVGAICPAPGASGAWKWNSESETPYLVMITGGTQDDVVGLNTPEGYHNNFNKNGVPHVWHVVQNGHHGDDSIHSHIYCFVRGIFQATD